MEGLGEYRKKPVDVLAVQLTRENLQEVAQWSNSKLVWVGKAGSPARIFEGLDLPTLSGIKRVEFGDYVVRYKSGAYGQWPADKFLETYGLQNLVLTVEG